MAGNWEQDEQMCWGCQATLLLPCVFCTKCNIIQPPIAINPFARLDLEPQFDLTAILLEEAYLKSLKNLHPDNFVGKSERERMFAQQHSAAANQAYLLLKDAHERAMILLKLLNPGLQHLPSPDPQTLQEIFLLREQMSALKMDEDQLTFRLTLEENLLECYHQLKDAFDQEDAFHANTLAHRYQYYSKILEEFMAQTPLERPSKSLH